MLIISTPSSKLDTSKQSIPLVIPNFNGQYALRYIWMTHRYDNDNFIKNYFTGGNDKGINVRLLTASFQTQWDIHNKIFYESSENGNLIWRVKVYNSKNSSIDYIEVWKDLVTVENLLESNKDWPVEEMDILKNGIFSAGFSAQKWKPFPSVSKEWATINYKKFLSMSKNKENCIINTPMKDHHD